VSRLLKHNGHELSFDDLPSEAKAESLIPILLASCLHLPSSPYKHAFQDIFGRLVFYARSSLCGFHVTHKESSSELTAEAKLYLNGCLLSSLMGASEEAFVRFLIITDFVKHHLCSICNLLSKYDYLLPDKEIHNQLNSLLQNWVGNKGSPKKGFRSSDITFYQSIKSQVLQEWCTNMNDSPMKTEDSTVHGANNLNCNHFIFDYPMSMCHGLKVESSGKKNKKRKLIGGEFVVGGPQTIVSLAMSLDDDDKFFSNSNLCSATVPM
jgi:hypothetical protein